MAIPVYLQKYKAAGIYRVVFDKSTIKGTDSEVLRLVVGYSEKGPFNTPVYITSPTEFISTFGKGSRKLENRGVFFHRMALQALEAGPILALNLKKFTNEHIDVIGFNPADINRGNFNANAKKHLPVEAIYNTSRFWKLDDKQLSGESLGDTLTGYIRIAATDVKSQSNTIFIRKTVDSAIRKSYDVTIREWFASEQDDMPEYLEGFEDMKVSDFLMDIYVFRGKFTSNVVADSLSAYFIKADEGTEDGTDKIVLVPFIENAFGDKLDTLDQLYFDERSGAVAKYTGFTLPYFQDKMGTYQSLDLLFNSDADLHHMMMHFDVVGLENGEYTENGVLKIVTTPTVATSADELFPIAPDEVVEPIVVARPADYHEDEDEKNDDDHAYDAYVEAKAEYDAYVEAKAEYDAYAAEALAYLQKNAAQQDYATAYLEGYEYEHSLPYKNGKAVSDDNSCAKWIEEYILDALIVYKGLRTGLISKSEIQYRYIVDTFKSFVGASCKGILSCLAKERENAFAILNFPSVETFKKYNRTQATFIDKATGQFDVQKVVSPKFGEFSLPSEAEGASFCAFYTALKFNDKGIISIVPSAALVSNVFMEKYKSRQPYYIVAGQNYGLISYTGLVGPDYNWSQDELQIIEPYGVNCLMYRPRVGTFINANQTAKQTPKSALSSVNVRELVIYLQDEIQKVLQEYHWEINSADVRAKILDRANYICQTVQNNNGLYAYLNIMDESNNTPEIIDNEMAILSTHIEPGKGCGKMVQELTLYRAGGMTIALSEK